MQSFTLRLLVILLGYVPVVASALADELHSNIPAYEPVRGISGNLSSVGSDTLATLMMLWGQQFSRFYPGVNIQIQAAGSSTVPPALTQSTANIGPVSRELQAGEIEAFEARYGYQPTAVPVAIDALAVFVHQDNPLPGLTLSQLDSLFSANRRCGSSRAIDTWGDMGLGGVWERRPIQRFGRNSVSGTYDYFREIVLCGGDFNKAVNEQTGSASVVSSVGASSNAIGYSGIGYRTSSVRVLPLARDATSPYVVATAENAIAGIYPLARMLYVYINKAPNRQLPPIEREFLDMILSQEGQTVVRRDGYIPLPVRVIDLARRELGF